MFSAFRPRRVGVLLAALVLVGCGERSSDDESTSLLAARVNEAEISAYEVSVMLERANIENQGAAADAARAEALERLIDEELILQKVRERHLERQPDVAKNIEAARREILVRAYLDQEVGEVAMPDEDELRSFFADNPALFAERRVYHFQEITVALADEHFDLLKAAVADSETLDEVAQWMTERGLAYRVTDAVRAAEQLPIENVEAFSRMLPGQIALTQTSEGAQMVYLADSRLEPLDYAAARPLIKEYLLNRTRSEAAAEKVARLRETARIDYLGAFVRAEDDPPSVPSAQGTGQDRPSYAASDPLQAVFERGVAGLK